jgi:ATP-dependent helicase/nuclease subunit B
MLLQDTELLDQALQNQALVLTPNYRSSDQLIDAICRYRESTLGSSVSIRPAITAIDTWLRELWTRTALLHPTPKSGCRILGSTEEKLLWQQVLRDNTEGLVLLQQDSATDSLASAWRLLQQWQVGIDTPAKIVQPGTNPFARDDLQWAAFWLQCFDRYCEQHGLLTFGGMVQHLIVALESTDCPDRLLPRSLVLWHFDQPPPLYQDLFSVLADKGCAIHHRRHTPANPAVSAFSLASARAECMQAARWARRILDESPDAVIGIVCPDANLLKGPLQRFMNRQFRGRESYVSSSLTLRLSDKHWFANAQLVLELANPVVSLSTICTLLRSPWIRGANTEGDARAALEHRIRDLDELQVSLTDLQYWCSQEQQPWYCPVLHQLLAENRHRWQRAGGSLPLADWYDRLLLHWEAWLPREYMLADTHDDLAAELDAFLCSLQQTRPGTGGLTLPAFMGLVRHLLTASNARENQRQTRVTLLTPTAATGMQFTHLWCLGMNEEHWPEISRPHPWLPVALQRDHNMPGCDHRQSLSEAVSLLQQLTQSATRGLVYSFAEAADDMPLAPSPLLPDDLPVQRITAEPGDGLPETFLQGAETLLETRADSRLLPPGKLEGASRLVRLQAECPFRAFAEERLSIRPLNNPAYGLSPAAIGTLVHEVLYRFWQEMQDSARLLDCSSETLQTHIDAAVNHGLNRLARRYPHTLTPGLRELEAGRLAALLRQWLQVELQRGEFTAVMLEEKLQWTHEQLTLRLRLDRVDRTPAGLAVVDYKTGQTGANTWANTSPAQFQLLLYLFALQQHQPEPVTMLLFGALHPKDIDYRGIAADDSVLPALAFNNPKLKVTEPEWQAVLTRWQSELAALARELLDGYAAVEPRQSNACQYCELGALCRVGELEVRA